MRISPIIGLATLAAFAVPAIANADPSPIFGKATVQIKTADQNKAVTGKGYLGSYYAYYGIYWANNASLWGLYGFYYQNAGYYGNAANDSYASYVDFYYANYYQARGL